MTNLSAWKQNRIRVLRTLFNENGAIAGSGPMSLLAGIGVLGLIFFTGLGVDRQSAQTVSMLQEDPLVQAVQQAVQLGQKEESERACIYWRIDKHGHFTTTLSRRDFY